MQRFGILPDILAPETIDRVKAEALATDWTTRPGAQIVYTIVTGEALARAIRAFGPEPLSREAWASTDADERELRARFYLCRVAEPDALPDALRGHLPVGEQAMRALLTQLVFVLHGHTAALAELERRATVHRGYWTACLALQMREDRRRDERAATGEPEPPRLPDRFTEHAAAAFQAFSEMFAAATPEGEQIVGRTINAGLLDALDAGGASSATRRQRAAGLLWEQLFTTLGKNWVDQDQFSDYALLAAGLDGRLDTLPLTWRLFDRARTIWARAKRRADLDERRQADDGDADDEAPPPDA